MSGLPVAQRQDSIAQALAILDRPTPQAPEAEAEDQLPKGYRWETHI